MSVLDEVAKLVPEFNWVAKCKDGRVFMFEMNTLDNLEAKNSEN